MAFPNSNKFVTLLFGRTRKGQITSKVYKALILDAVLSEDHQFNNRVTDFPVEDNSNISDHVLQEPERLTMEGFVTNSPIEFFGDLSDQTGDLSLNRPPDRVNDAFLALMQFCGYDYPIQEGTKSRVKNPIATVDLVTGLRSYSDMILEKLNVPRNKELGDALKFTAVFKKVNKVIEAIIGTVPEQINENASPGNAARSKDQAVTSKNTSTNQTKPSTKSVGFITNILNNLGVRTPQ